ncbi:MAG: hypothetical protein C5B52_09690 [Bacteroidetes bacterium]|nr:MAG: hypothetical protein C5B52_09690 [Bacteroidota bacterium]
MFKKLFYQGICAGLLAALAAIIYNRIYIFAFETNFSKIVNLGSMIGSNLFADLLAAIGYFICLKWFKKRADVIFNFAFTILSFASIIIPMSMTLPLDIQNPEMFPGLTVPMHFFPALAWFTVKPLFQVKQN